MNVLLTFFCFFIFINSIKITKLECLYITIANNIVSLRPKI